MAIAASSKFPLALLFSVLAAMPTASAQGYPSKPISIVVPFAPGGSVDLVARAVASKLGPNLNSAVIVENRPGASAEIGMAAVVRAAPDGYTLLTGSTTSISIRPQTEPPLPFDPATGLSPITLAASVPHVLLVGSSVPAKSVKELVAYAKTLNRPLTLGDSGVGSPHALAGDLFSNAAGVEITHVPYKGTSAVIVDLLAGTIDLASVELSIAAPYMKNDKLSSIGISARNRDPAWPNLATIAEQGLPAYEITSWFGFFAPAKTPAQIVSKLNLEINKVLTDSEVRTNLTSAGLTVTGTSLEEFQTHLQREKEKWGLAIKLGKIAKSASQIGQSGK